MIEYGFIVNQIFLLTLNLAEIIGNALYCEISCNSNII